MQLDGLDDPRPQGPQIPVEDLAVYEAHGGHTLRRHVGPSPEDNLRRIEDGSSGSGCFTDQRTAQRAVETAIRRHRDDVVAWQWGPTRALPFSFVEDLSAPIGTTLTCDEVLQGITTPSPATALRVVLRPSSELAGGFLLVTAYPTHARRTIPRGDAPARRDTAGVPA